MGQQQSSPATQNVYDLSNAVNTLYEQKVELERIRHENAKLKEVINAQKQSNQELTTKKGILEKEKAELQASIDRLKKDNINLQQNLNDSLKANKQQIANHEITINEMKENTAKEITKKIEAVTRGTEDRMKKLEKENAKLSDPNRICSLEKNVDDFGKVDYIQLSGKILMVQKLENNNGKWYTDGGTEITFEHSDFQICVHNELVLKNVRRSTIPDRIFYYNIKKLCLADLTISFNEYKNIVANIKDLSLRQITVKGKHGYIIDLADLLKEVPDIEKFEYIFKEDETIPTQKLVQLPSFSKLQQFNLCEINKNFDLTNFAEFMKNNPSVFYDISCLSDFYKKVAKKYSDFPSNKLKITKLQHC